MLKKRNLLLKIAAFILLTATVGHAYAKSNQQITHVVIVWLKQPGDTAMRHQFIKASNQLNDLPGIVSRYTGVVAPSDRSIVDDTFDVAVTVTLKNKQALQAYLNNPRHKKIMQEQIKPLVNRAVIYDFISE